MGKMNHKDLADLLDIRLDDLSPEKVSALKAECEWLNFIEFLKSLDGNFTRARWRGREVRPEDLQ